MLRVLRTAPRAQPAPTGRRHGPDDPARPDGPRGGNGTGYYGAPGTASSIASSTSPISGVAVIRPACFSTRRGYQTVNEISAMLNGQPATVFSTRYHSSG